MPYNPFSKPIWEKLTSEDLDNLVKNAVAEGYFVEYKGILPDPKKIAKSIASFANTYGGWYIVGVTTDGHNVAKKITGFSLDDTHDPIAKMRDSVRLGIDPVPVFFPQVVELSEKLVVLVVYIPGEQDTPFITKDGRIYRRVNDSSDPLQETQRASIDRLVDQGRDRANEFRRFCQDPRSSSKAEDEAQAAWINIFISPYPLGMIERFDITSKEGLEKILKRSSETIPLIKFREEGPSIGGNIPFQQGRATINSVFLKQIIPHNNQIINNTLAMEIFTDGRTRFFIPLQRINVINHEGVVSSNVNSQNVKKWLEKYFEEDNELCFLKFFNLTQLWQVVLIMTNFYLDSIKSDFSLIHDFRIAVRGTNLWRTVGFVDHDRWAEHVQTFHLPVITDGDITLPETKKYGIPIDISDGDTPALWGALIQLVGMMFGFPVDVLQELMITFLRDSIGDEP